MGSRPVFIASRSKLSTVELARQLVPGIDHVPVKAIPLSTVPLVGKIPAIVAPVDNVHSEFASGLIN